MKIWIASLESSSGDKCVYAFDFEPSQKDVGTKVKELNQLHIFTSKNTVKDFLDKIDGGIVSCNVEETTLLEKR